MKRRMCFILFAFLSCLFVIAAAELAPAQIRFSLTSVNPQKVTLLPGGNPVIVEATGTGLSIVYYAVVLRSGAEASMISANVDRSQLPVLKISFRAAPTASIANDYQLRILNAARSRVLDLPISMLTIECVSATGQKIGSQSQPNISSTGIKPDTTIPIGAKTVAQPGTAVPVPRDAVRIVSTGAEFIDILFGNQGRFAGYDLAIKNTGSRSFKLSELQSSRCTIASTIFGFLPSNPTLVIESGITTTLQAVVFSGPGQKANLPIGQVSHTWNLSIWKGYKEGTVFSAAQQVSVHNNGKKGDPVDILANAIKVHAGNASSYAGWEWDQYPANINADTWLLFAYKNISKNTPYYSSPYKVKCAFTDAGKNISNVLQGSTMLGENSIAILATNLGRLPAGTYHAVCSVDPEAVLWDTNVANNERTFEFTVNPTGVTWPPGGKAIW